MTTCLTRFVGAESLAVPDDATPVVMLWAVRVGFRQFSSVLSV